MYFLLEEKEKMTHIRQLLEEDIPKNVMSYVSEAEHIHGCRMDKDKEVIAIHVAIPKIHTVLEPARKKEVPLLGKTGVGKKFSLLITEQSIWMLDYDDYLKKILPTIFEQKEESTKRQEEMVCEKSPTQIMYWIFQYLVEGDGQLFDAIYKQLAALEEEITRENSRFFLHKMHAMKQTIYVYFCFYHQLTEIAEDLLEYDHPFLEKRQMKKFEKFIARTSRLVDDMEIMREYAMEIWEIYQSQINIRQNDIMKVLTIVTTIFFPLSLLASWYGMNFKYMPEIYWEYGYVAAIGAGITIVAFLLILFKKKKYW